MACVVAVLRTNCRRSGPISSATDVFKLFSLYGEVQAIDAGLLPCDGIAYVTYYDVRDARQATVRAAEHPAVRQCFWKNGFGEERRLVSMPAPPYSWNLETLREHLTDRFGEPESLQFQGEMLHVVFFSSISAVCAKHALANSSSFKEPPRRADSCIEGPVTRDCDFQQATAGQGRSDHRSHVITQVAQPQLASDFFEPTPGLSWDSPAVTHLHAKPITDSSQGNDPGENEDLESEMFIINLEAIKAGKDRRTTCMVRNIPNRYTQLQLTEVIERRLPNLAYDFVYVPMNRHNRRNVGYAFVNFMDPMHVIPFHEAFHGRCWPEVSEESSCTVRKLCAVVFARIQGRHELHEHFNPRCFVGRQNKPLFRQLNDLSLDQQTASHPHTMTRPRRGPSEEHREAYLDRTETLSTIRDLKWCLRCWDEEQDAAWHRREKTDSLMEGPVL